MPAEKHGKGTAPAGIPLISPAKDGLGPEGRKKLKNAGVPMNPILGEEQFVEPGCPCPSTPGIITKTLELPSARQENAPVLEGTTTVNGFPTLSPEAAALNAFCAAASGLSVGNPLTVVVPSNTGAFSCLAEGSSSVFVMIPGVLGQGHPGSTNCSSPSIGFIGTPAFFNFFRPSGPNPSFAGLISGIPAGVVPFPCFSSGIPAGYAGEVALAKCASYPGGFGVPVPFNSVDAQLSNGNSWYNSLTFNLSKRFSKGFELLSSYTWYHSIDDSTDLQSPLEPQDSSFPNLE